MSANSSDTARFWANEIIELTTRLLEADLRGDDSTGEALRQQIQESALSIEVRCDWYAVGRAPSAPDQFRIVLCTGGPHVEIQGDLMDGDTQSIRLMHQGWFEELREYRCDGLSTALDVFCAQFYFGEG